MKFALYLVLLCGLAFTGCLERDLPSQPEKSPIPSVEILQVPDQITFGQTYRLSVKVSDEQGPDDVVLVQLSINSTAVAQPVLLDSLWDDGATLVDDDGDVIARDGIFTQLLHWLPQDSLQGDLNFIFFAVDKSGNKSEFAEKTVKSVLNEPPQLNEISAPSLLASGFDTEMLLTATVTDVNAARVHFIGTPKDLANSVGPLNFEGDLLDGGENGDVIAGDNVFSLAITAEFAAAKKGTYAVSFQAVDVFGDTSATISQDIVIENEKPTVANLSGPDVVTLPSSGVKPVLITLDVSDDQGLGDVEFVGFMSLKPDSSLANSGQPIPMVDNGLPFDLNRWNQHYFGDQIAGDGTYSFSAPLQPTDARGQYIWTFFALDWVGNSSDSLTKIISIQ